MIKFNLDKVEKSESPILDRKTILEQYSISKSTLWRWLHIYGLKHYKVNRRVFIKKTDFDKWFENYSIDNND
ncbi:DNA-binding protein [Candidatus Marinimicrobia bacterium PRS2]|nr:DNA-binding protein [Candidatus Marinimicrobia bacterium PRS2]|tara:strand:- start:55 stop:270 length:216 start_codon:yes stop_codon:yes gene_type:complete